VAAVLGPTSLAVSTAAAEGDQLPGMCNGRSDANVVVNALARGDTKYVLNALTDATGTPEGVLILGKDGTRFYVDQFCRVWQHLPGQEPGSGSGCSADVPEGATIVHAVGLGQLDDGTRVLVRTDARETEEGKFFRVRYRAMGGHEEELVALAEDDGCAGDDWVSVPDEGWAPLNRLSVRVVTD
jgi:hypothetical protein